MKTRKGACCLEDPDTALGMHRMRWVLEEVMLVRSREDPMGRDVRNRGPDREARGGRTEKAGESTQAVRTDCWGPSLQRETGG